MLNKPQHIGEILQGRAVGETGAAGWFTDDMSLQGRRLGDTKRLSDRLAWTHEVLEETWRMAVERCETNKRLEGMVEATVAEVDTGRSVHWREIEEVSAIGRGQMVRPREKVAELDHQFAAARSAQAQLAVLLTSSPSRTTRPVQVIGRLQQRR